MKFNKIWANQTEIGRQYGLSSIAVGKLLMEHGLRDRTTKAATPDALNNGIAQFTPLADGTPFFMWNREKIGQIIQKTGFTQVSPTDFHTSRVTDKMKAALRPSSNDKLNDIALDCFEDMLDEFLEDTPKAIRPEVKKNVMDRLQQLGMI